MNIRPPNYRSGGATVAKAILVCLIFTHISQKEKIPDSYKCETGFSDERHNAPSADQLHVHFTPEIEIDVIALMIFSLLGISQYMCSSIFSIKSPEYYLF